MGEREACRWGSVPNVVLIQHRASLQVRAVMKIFHFIHSSGAGNKSPSVCVLQGVWAGD